MITHKFINAVKLDNESLPEGTVDLIAAVYGNVDRYNERIVYGYFDASIEAFKQGTPIMGLWQHDPSAPVARTVEVRSLAPHDALLPASLKNYGGLFVRAEFNTEPGTKGAEVYSNIKKGILSQYSVGIQTFEDRIADDGVRELIKGKLWEWSVVTFPVNNLTTTINKSMYNSLSFDAHVNAVRVDIAGLVDRLKARVDMRTKEGRVLSSSNVNSLNEHLNSIDNAISALQDSAADIRTLADSAKPEDKAAILRMAVIKAKHNYHKGN